MRFWIMSVLASPAEMKCGYAAEVRRRRACATPRSMPYDVWTSTAKGRTEANNTRYRMSCRFTARSKKRPDVGCVIHAHPKEALICGITELEFRPIFGAFNITAMRMALEGIPIFPRSYLVNRPELAAPMIEIMGEKPICLMKGHGITVTGKTVEETTVRALNFNTLARVTLQVTQTGRSAPDISSDDIEKLPDLGSTFNDTWVWRYYVRKLKEEDSRLSH